MQEAKTTSKQFSTSERLIMKIRNSIGLPTTDAKTAVTRTECKERVCSWLSKCNPSLGVLLL